MLKVWLQIMVIGSFLLLSSCIKEDFDNITSQYEWQPSFSFPLSTTILNTGDYNSNNTFLEEYNQSAIVEMSEEVAFNFSEIFLEPLNGENVEVEQIMFRLEIINDFPGIILISNADVTDTYQILSLISGDGLSISPAQVDDEGHIISSERLLHDVYVPKNDIELLTAAKKIEIKAFIHDLDTRKSVLDRIDEYNIKIRIGVRAKVKAKVDFY
jgi:hypothetical protein